MPAWATPQPVDDADLQAQIAAAEAARNTDDDALRALILLLNGYVDTLETKLTPPLLVETGLGTDLAAVLAKLIAAPSTEANQDTANTKLDTLHDDLASAVEKLAEIAAPATITVTSTDAFGNWTAWTQNGIDYVAEFDGDGNLVDQGLA